MKLPQVGKIGGMYTMIFSPEIGNIATWLVFALAWVGLLTLMFVAVRSLVQLALPDHLVEACSQDGVYTAVVRDGAIRVSNATTGERLSCIACALPVRALLWSPDCSYLAAITEEGRVCVWNACTGALLFASITLVAPGVSVAWSPDTKRLALICADRSLQVWDTLAWKSVYWSPRIFAPEQPISELLRYGVYSLVWSPSGAWLAISDEGGSLRVWNSATYEMSVWQNKQGYTILSLAFAEGVSCILSGDAAGKVCIWDFRSGKELWSWPHSCAIIRVAWGQGACAGDVLAWDETGTPFRMGRDQLLSVLHRSAESSPSPVLA
jgi:WD40 repeat protein